MYIFTSNNIKYSHKKTIKKATTIHEEYVLWLDYYIFEYNANYYFIFTIEKIET